MFVITPTNAKGEFVALRIVVKQAATGSGQCDKYGEYEMVKTELNIVEANLIPVLGWKWVVRTSLKSRITLQQNYNFNEGRPNAKHK